MIKLSTELALLYHSIDLERWGDSAHFYQGPQMAKGLHTCCIRTPKWIGTNCDTRSFSNFDPLQHPIRTFPDRGSFLNNDQFAVLHSILGVVGVVLGHSVWINHTELRIKHVQSRGFDNLFGIVVSTSDYRPRGPGFDSRLYPRNFSGSIGSGTGTTQPHEDNWVAAWYEKKRNPVKKTEIKVVG